MATRTLDTILLSRTHECPSHRFLYRPVHDTADTDVEEITYSIFNKHVSMLARKFTTSFPDLLKTKSIVGVLFPSGYPVAVTMFALIRLGVVPFCLSPRNSDEALSHLIKTGAAVAAVAYVDAGLSARLKEVLAKDGIELPILEVSKQELAKLDIEEEEYPPLPEGVIDITDAAMQQHTSGSTAFPKPVPLSHEMIIRSAEGGTWWVDGFHTQQDISVGQPPIFHFFGLIGGLVNSVYRGHTFAIPPIPASDNGGLFPSSQTLLTYAKKVGATEFFGVSSTVVGLARTEGGLDLFRGLKRVLVGGAPMPRASGDWIVSEGVHLVEGMGSTEGGSLMNSNRPRGDPDWQGMCICGNVEHHFQLFSGSAVGSTVQTGVPVYELILHNIRLPTADPVTGHLNTHDLFVEYPKTGSGRWRHVGRSDDVLLLSSGQSWNPRPMELMIEAHEVVKNAVVYGHARPYLGALITPIKDSADEKEKIWAAVESANAVAPSNARIARRTILVVTSKGVIPLDSNTPLDLSVPANESTKVVPVADKGTPLRPKTYALFKEEIDWVYADAF
ncbi:acetyl-CoA synthetase-like protein [Marasmius fiardii PR-910]|nr:acetyl-CoA synthetase-like protein [Marasmius fiardii PR-910]